MSQIHHSVSILGSKSSWTEWMGNTTNIVEIQPPSNITNVEER